MGSLCTGPDVRACTRASMPCARDEDCLCLQGRLPLHNKAELPRICRDAPRAAEGQAQEIDLEVRGQRCDGLLVQVVQHLRWCMEVTSKGIFTIHI